MLLSLSATMTFVLTSQGRLQAGCRLALALRLVDDAAEALYRGVEVPGQITDLVPGADAETLRPVGATLGNARIIVFSCFKGFDTIRLKKAPMISKPNTINAELMPIFVNRSLATVASSACRE